MGNRILESMGIKKDDVLSSIRISFNAYMDKEEIIEAGNKILETVSKIVNFEI